MGAWMLRGIDGWYSVKPAWWSSRSGRSFCERPCLRSTFLKPLPFINSPSQRHPFSRSGHRVPDLVVFGVFRQFFSPVYTYLFGFHVFGLGFITSMLFIFATGVFTSSWMGSALVKLSEYIIRKVPLVKHIYSAAKQVSAAVSPDNSATHSFRWVGKGERG